MLIDVDLVSLHAGVNKSTHWGSPAYLRRFHRQVHAKSNLQIPGMPSMSLLTGELTEVANGAVMYVVRDSPITCIKITIRQFFLKPNGGITLLLEPMTIEPIHPWLRAGVQVWHLQLCEALGAGCLFYREMVKVRIYISLV